MKLGSVDLRTVLVSIAAAGILWMVQTVVDGQSAKAVLAERVAQHEKQITQIEAVVSKLADTQARQAATQEQMTKLLERLDRQ